jgi:hypothetical protein
MRLEERDEDVMLAWIQESTLWAEINLAGEGFQTYTTGMKMYFDIILNDFRSLFRYLR